MPDREIDDTPRRYDGGVVFRTSLANGSLVVRVSDEALDDRERSSRAHADRLAAFQRHRYAIESVARRKQSQNQREKDGSILVTTSDLNG